MTAAARWLALAALAAVLVAVVLVAALWSAYGPQGLWIMAWLAVLAGTVIGAVLAWEALAPQEEASDG